MFENKYKINSDWQVDVSSMKLKKKRGKHKIFLGNKLIRKYVMAYRDLKQKTNR